MPTNSTTIIKNIKRTYDSIAKDFSRTRNTEWKEFDLILPFIKSNIKIADIGCGNGRFFKFLSKHIPTKYTGVDFSKNLLKEAKKLNPAIKNKFIYGEITKIPLKNESQNIVACIAVFHHLPTITMRKKAVNELSRILKKDGILFITTWNLQKKGANFIPWGKEKIPRYYYSFKQREITDLLEKKFKIIKKLRNKNLIFICKKK